jgi:transposase
MDNCPTHHNDGGWILQEFLQDLNIELVYMPAYSPDFNPAEYVFGKIRTVMKYKLGNMTNTNIHQCVQSFYTSLDYISLADMQSFYEITGYLDV